MSSIKIKYNTNAVLSRLKMMPGSSEIETMRSMVQEISDINDASSELEGESSAIFWEKTAKKHEQASAYYQQQLVDAHALLGRVVHQLSERWDSVNLTKYFPTDNLHRKKGISNPSGEK